MESQKFAPESELLGNGADQDAHFPNKKAKLMKSQEVDPDPDPEPELELDDNLLWAPAKVIGGRMFFVRSLVSIDYVRVKNVRVNYVDGEPLKVFGTVKVNDWGGDDEIAYCRSSDNYESKVLGKCALLSLTGPSTSVHGSDEFVITVELWAVSSTRNYEISRGEIVWDVKIHKSTFDQLLEKDVSGEYGSVTVGYSVIRYGLNATIQVMMINGDRESPVDVYGTIKAFYILGRSESETMRTLFEKSENECIQVIPRQPIPLTRPVFPVPVDCYLTITADLWDCDSLSPIHGYLDFSPIIGTQTRNITCEYRKLQVSITFE